MARCCPKSWIKFFKAVCDEPRQKILEILHEKEKMNASEIKKKLNLSQPTISHHLKILVEAEVVKSEKKGKEVFYTLSNNQIDSCCTGFAKHFAKHHKKK
jgi:ArsR family transcriptional regulator, arsenate/arsenite/antimonite-responsive transcriptional repressor